MQEDYDSDENQVMNPQRDSNTSFMLEHMLNSVILLFSYSLTVTGDKAILLIIEILQAKLAKKQTIACGTIQIHEILDGFPDRLNKNLVKEVIERTKLEQAQEFKKIQEGNSIYAQVMRHTKEGLVKRPPKRGESESFGTTHRSSCEISEKDMYGSKFKFDMCSGLEKLRDLFSGCNRRKYEEFNEQHKDRPIKVTRPEQVKLIKFFSLSCGLHDRFHGSSELNQAELQSKEKLEQLAKRVVNDFLVPKAEPIPDHIIEEVNELVLKERSAGTLKEFKDKCGLSKKKIPQYKRSENIVYFRDGLNGRPDLVLVDEDDRILGIVEVKSSSHKPTDLDQTGPMRQLALYHIMLQPIESYLFTHRRGDGRFNSILESLKDESLTRAQEFLPNLKENQAKFIKNAIEYFKG